MTVFGIGVFIAGWIYSVGAFGFFLGVSLGWIPALIMAHIADFLFILVLMQIMTLVAVRREMAGRHPARSPRVIGRSLQRANIYEGPSAVSRLVTSILYAVAAPFRLIARVLRRIKDVGLAVFEVINRYALHAAAFVIIGGIAAMVFEREIDGTCTQLQLAQTRSAASEIWLRDQGISPDDVRTSGNHDLWARYALLNDDDWAWNKALEYRKDTWSIPMLEAEIVWPQVCVFRALESRT